MSTPKDADQVNPAELAAAIEQLSAAVVHYQKENRSRINEAMDLFRQGLGLLSEIQNFQGDHDVALTAALAKAQRLSARAGSKRVAAREATAALLGGSGTHSANGEAAAQPKIRASSDAVNRLKAAAGASQTLQVRNMPEDREGRATATGMAAIPPTASDSESVDLQTTHGRRRAMIEAEDQLVSGSRTSASTVALTSGIHTLIRQVENFQGRLLLLRNLQVMPDSQIPVDAEFCRQAVELAEIMSDTFNEMHDECMKAARHRLEELRRAGRNTTNPIDFWPPKSLREYDTFRTKWIVEKVLDPLELRARQLKDAEHSVYLSMLAAQVGITRLHMEQGVTTYNAEHHEAVDLQPATGNQETVINRVLLSGYLESSDGHVLRKAFVQTRLRDRDEPRAQPLSLRRTDVNMPAMAAASSDYASGAGQVTVTDLGQVNLPGMVQDVKAMVLKTNGSVSTIISGELPSAIGGPVNLEVRSAVTEYVNRFCRNFQQFHERSKALAFLTFKRMRSENPELDSPSAGWEEQLLFEYRVYRTKRFLEECLDPIESKILQLGILDHLKVLDLLSDRMGIGRLPVLPGETLFNQDRHQMDARLISGTQDPRNKPIARLLQSGYYDIRKGNTILRKASVRVNL